ncbi:unnamed protein product [Rotaria sp. Silwood2]|nr:unnamed protein product [Rotaria sp. Silwood2]
MSHILSTAIPEYKVPHPKTVRNRIAALYSTYTTKLRALLPKLGPLALTSDLWRNSRRTNFISLTAHIFTENYKSIPIVLGCRHVVGPHLATSIERYLKYELHRFGIKKEQIISITTDNGSNMKKATSSLKFGDRISCMAHNLNSVIKKSLCLWNEPKPDDIAFQSNFDTDEWEDLDDDEFDDTSECAEDTDDAVSDLISEEEDNSSNSEDDTDVNEKNNNESDSDSDVDLVFSSLTLNDNNSSSIDYFKLLSDIFELIKKKQD